MSNPSHHPILKCQESKTLHGLNGIQTEAILSLPNHDDFKGLPPTLHFAHAAGE